MRAITVVLAISLFGFSFCASSTDYATEANSTETAGTAIRGSGSNSTDLREVGPQRGVVEEINSRTSGAGTTAARDAKATEVKVLGESHDGGQLTIQISPNGIVAITTDPLPGYRVVGPEVLQSAVSQAVTSQANPASALPSPPHETQAPDTRVLESDNSAPTESNAATMSRLSNAAGITSQPDARAINAGSVSAETATRLILITFGALFTMGLVFVLVKDIKGTGTKSGEADGPGREGDDLGKTQSISKPQRGATQELTSVLLAKAEGLIRKTHLRQEDAVRELFGGKVIHELMKNFIDTVEPRALKLLEADGAPFGTSVLGSSEVQAKAGELINATILPSAGMSALEPKARELLDTIVGVTRYRKEAAEMRAAEKVKKAQEPQQAKKPFPEVVRSDAAYSSRGSSAVTSSNYTPPPIKIGKW